MFLCITRKKHHCKTSGLQSHNIRRAKMKRHGISSVPLYRASEVVWKSCNLVLPLARNLMLKDRHLPSSYPHIVQHAVGL